MYFIATEQLTLFNIPRTMWKNDTKQCHNGTRLLQPKI